MLMKATDLPTEGNEDLLDTVGAEDQVLVAMDNTGTAHLVLMAEEGLVPVEQLFVTNRLILLDTASNADVHSKQETHCTTVVIKKDDGDLHCIGDVFLATANNGEQPVRENRSGDIVGFLATGMGAWGTHGLFQISAFSTTPDLDVKKVFHNEDGHTEDCLPRFSRLR